MMIDAYKRQHHYPLPSTQLQVVERWIFSDHSFCSLSFSLFVLYSLLLHCCFRLVFIFPVSLQKQAYLVDSHMINLMMQQGFNWESSNKAGGWYNSLKNLVADLSNAGVTHVWLPPPSQSAAPQGRKFLALKYVLSLHIYTI